MYKLEYSKKFIHGKIRPKKGTKLNLNKDLFDGTKLLVSFILICSSIYITIDFSNTFKSLYVEKFGVYNIKFYWVILYYIVSIFVIFYNLNIIFRSVIIDRYLIGTMSCFGVGKPFAGYLIELNNPEFIGLKTDNIEKRIYYKDISDIVEKKQYIKIKYNKRNSIIIFKNKNEYKKEIAKKLFENWKKESK
ncbi:TPA: hypothetical protein ACY4SM_001278 [Clostridium perfringens]|uniref:hypothetical protein n=2 Tax=Clostridium perfringens TaxID=1502 RepID=UPI00123EFEBE|nr:hypothetical protein [Clostridium perfringens]EGT0014558.1 hypothetical protein [Clostridium perfringens]EGT4139291.1 hypothetical protein [Clostridium perfringens]EJT6340830.1 hypothetical protein [Clostridium perfringens]ELQ0171924.1 hypothetical protein [Clostridium perfringens]ELU5586946.1 hypothetical protein [Clostridium perfringens]